ncbi:MAG: histone deacetylase [Thermoanaerobaculum sp.]|nr:histone deacetylase [Thermoanaerobaculum sp.]MDW7966741.1 histone deacetylase [Thermoanaerobaculum sp.]
MARLEAALAGARRAGFAERTPAVDEEAVLQAIVQVHDPRLPERLREACRRAPSFFDSADNPISPGTFAAAVAAVGCVLDGLAHIMAGNAPRVFAAVRPPGHHATRSQAMGFCFFNNVAVAAEAALQKGFGPVAIVDFDVHHGNGTQELFYHRDDVFYLSLHRYPYYPGTGGADEIGVGRGRGFTRNLPLAPGADDEVYLGALALGLEEVMRAMSPHMWLISAGFDAHELDPLGGMAVTTEGFQKMGKLLAQAAGSVPVLVVLEGGYNLDALKESVAAFLSGLSQVGSGSS